MITEFGPRGTWQMNPEPERVLPWGGLVEQTSSEKEADYLKAYQENIAVNKDNGCLGSFVFLWGYQTHGEVLTWYGLFDKRIYLPGSRCHAICMDRKLSERPGSSNSNP